jgi:hypothetical protein
MGVGWRCLTLKWHPALDQTSWQDPPRHHFSITEYVRASDSQVAQWWGCSSGFMSPPGRLRATGSPWQRWRTTTRRVSAGRDALKEQDQQRDEHSDGGEHEANRA